MATLNTVAQAFRRLHVPGQPVVLANVWDAVSARAVASLPSSKALATASYAVAASAGFEDDDMDMETNLRAAAAVAKVAKEFKKPVSVDFQDGYGSKLEEGIRRLIELDIVGINLEDADKEAGKMYSEQEAANRVSRAVAAAKKNGVEDFVVNARCDVLLHGGTIEEAVSRGQAYLKAGAANVFVWGGSKRGGISAAEVAQLIDAFVGKLNVSVKLAPGGLTPKELAGMGVARLSVGPTFQFAAAETIKKNAEAYLSGK
jgi:2-methylisocitrate lyase-like PEP mutase family enzyme